MTNTILVNQSKALRLMLSTLHIFLMCYQYHDGIWLNKMLICLISICSLVTPSVSLLNSLVQNFRLLI